MPEETDAQVLSDHKLFPISFYRKIGLAFVSICFLIGAIYVGYAYYAGPYILEAQLIGQLEKEIAELEANPPAFEFVIVPNALTMITVPERMTSNPNELLAEFAEARNSTALIDGDHPTIFNMPVGEIAYIEYINDLPLELREPIFQMHDELLALTRVLGAAYEQVPLAARVGQQNQLAYPEYATATAMQPLVYPSVRVVEAAFVGELLASQFPSEATFYREYAEQYINNGVGYGYYTSQEAGIARLLVTDYLSFAKESGIAQPVLQSLE